MIGPWRRRGPTVPGGIGPFGGWSIQPPCGMSGPAATAPRPAAGAEHHRRARRLRRRHVGGVERPPGIAGIGRIAEVVVARQVRHRLAGERRAHEALPGDRRQAAAGGVLGRRVVVVAEPHARGQRAGVADEPGIAKILARAGLAGHRPAGNRGLGAGAVDHRLRQHGIHHADIGRVDHLSRPGAAALVEHLALGRGDPLDRIGDDAAPAIGEGHIGRRQFQRRHLRGAERDRGRRHQRRDDAEPAGGGGDRLRRHDLASAAPRPSSANRRAPSAASPAPCICACSSPASTRRSTPAGRPSPIPGSSRLPARSGRRRA